MGNRWAAVARWVASSVFAVGFLASAAIAWRTADAGFVGTSHNNLNTWSAGTVALTDNDSNTALFTASGLKPGNTGSTCITATYGGSLDGTVKVFVAPGDLTGSLGQYINLTIDQGTAGPFGSSCRGSRPAAPPIRAPSPASRPRRPTSVPEPATGPSRAARGRPRGTGSPGASRT